MKLQNSRSTRMVGLPLLAALLATGCISIHTTERPPTQAEAQDQIQQRLHEIITAAESKDFDRLDSYHLYGPKFTKFAGSSPDRLDAAAARKGEHDGIAAAQNLKMRADVLKVDVFDNVAIATFILDYSFESGGQVVHKRDRSTLVFVNDGGEWKITHEHLSPSGP